MYELKNYTFVDDYSMLIYHDVSSLHLFIVTGKLFPRVLIGKKGIAFLKNDVRFNKIIGYKFSSFSLSKSYLSLDPFRLKYKQDNAIEVKFNNALTNKENTLMIKKVTLDYIQSNFKNIRHKASRKVKNSLSINYSKSVHYFKLKIGLIQIKS